MSQHSPGRSRLTLALIWWGAWALFSAAITIISSRALPFDVTGGIPGGDKIVHAAAFTVWGVLFACALASTFPGAKAARIVACAALGALLFGLLDELHQSTVVGRTADPWDWVADSCGGLLGGFAWWFGKKALLSRASK